MKTTLLGILAISIFTVSCKKDERATYIKEEAGVQQPAVAVNQTPKASILDQAGIKTTTGSETSTVTSPGMNPPHGQPGHRCDIPVGQPLNSAPAQPQQGTQNIAVNAPQGQTIQIDPNSLQPGKFAVDQSGKAKTVKTPKGMNPPHGEPGHRCDIPVGQPLNSKPAPVQQPVQQNMAQNAPAPVPTPAPTGPKPAVNPPHGEPWHDCAKKVGEAL